MIAPFNLQDIRSSHEHDFFCARRAQGRECFPNRRSIDLKICGWDFTESQVVPDPLPFRLRWHRRLHKMEAYSRLVLERLPHRMPRPKESSRACHLTAPTVAQNPEGFASARDGSATTRCPKPNASPELLFEAQSVPVSLGDRSLTELAPPPSSGRQGELWKTFIVILRKVPLQTWSVILGLIFSLVQPLKALFTPVPSWTGNKIQNAPDGNPPLHVILETAEYLGAVTVPLALIQLGASFGRLKVRTTTHQTSCSRAHLGGEIFRWPLLCL